jgi:hypothetical protein
LITNDDDFVVKKSKPKSKKKLLAIEINESKTIERRKKNVVTDDD